jgi:hypothetical protein
MAQERVGAPLTGRLGEALRAVAGALAALPFPGMLIGGMAVIARGVPRLTRDVDATVAGGMIDLDGLVSQLAAQDLVPRIDDAVRFAAANQVLLLRHRPSGIDVDLSIAWLPFETEALALSDLLDLGGVSVRVARAEDLVVYKAVAFRPQDQQDIERLLTLHGPKMDLVRVRRIVGEFADAMDEPDRVGRLDAIIRDVLG